MQQIWSHNLTVCQISVIFQFCIRALPCRLLSVIADNIDALFNSECKWSLIVVTDHCRSVVNGIKCNLTKTLLCQL